MDPVNGLVQILRQKLSERPNTVESKNTSKPSATNTTSSTEAKLSIGEVKRKIGERVKALSDDEHQPTHAAQIFVESIITWEFGDQLLQDPKFGELSKDVVNTLSQHPTVWKHMQSMLSEFK